MKNIRRILNVVSFGLLIAAVVQQLRLPSDQRTWHGTVAGFVPYDLRFPTPQRLRQAVWSPANPRILVPMAFGVGWSVNLAGIFQRVRL